MDEKSPQVHVDFEYYFEKYSINDLEDVNEDINKIIKNMLEDWGIPAKVHSWSWLADQRVLLVLMEVDNRPLKEDKNNQC